jgi:hypothetical protein
MPQKSLIFRVKDFPIRAAGISLLYPANRVISLNNERYTSW